MNVDDLIVEVRDVDLRRVGQVPPSEVNLTYTGVYNNVGSWELTIPMSSTMVDVLSAPGSGIVIYGPHGVIDSGPMISFEMSVTPDTPGGVVTFKGLTDNVHLADRLVSPGGTDFSSAHFDPEFLTLQGPVEDVMHTLVNQALGPAAELDRRLRNFVSEPSMGAGPIISKRFRWDNLGAVLGEMAAAHGFGFRMKQVEDSLVFEVYTARDRTGRVRFDPLNNTAAAVRVAVVAPTCTFGVVGLDGEGKDRWFHPDTFEYAEASTEAWGRRMEAYVDYPSADGENRDSDAEAQITELFAETARTRATVEIVPLEDSEGLVRFGEEWRLGDTVTAVANGVEYRVPVTTVVLKATSSGLSIGAKLGELGSPKLSIRRRVALLERMR